jgi:EAL domain-containing protein (putative c-di-GMP-specific phosphodiesterase class I)
MTIRRELFSGEVLYRQGDPSDCAWLVEHGAIELVSVQGRRTIGHGVLGPGELIGELGMLDGAPRSATATARGDTSLLAIDHDQFLERLDAGDPIVRTLVDSLLQRTRSIIASLPTDAALPAEDVACDDPGERSGIDKIRLEARLHDALHGNTLEVRYQPIYDIHAGRVSGYEALVRWELPDRGPVSPAEFIKLAEETSLIVPVGEYVLDRVIGVLKLEVTESRMLDYAPVAAVMQHCRDNGVPFALDDFGTGYSNLTHLHKLHFEFVKVDQAFARHMFDSPRAMAIVEAIVAMAHGIGADVVCEGVETKEQLQRLRELGVRYAQGYLIGQAAPAAAVLSGEAARLGAAAAAA